MPERQVKIVITAEDKTAKALSGVSKRLKSAGQSMIGLGAKMTLGLTLPIVALGVKTAKMAGDFEAQMNIMAIAARSSGTSLENLEKAAITTGADIGLVGIDAVQAADAMTSMYKAGLSTADMFGGPTGLNRYVKEGTNLTGALRAAVDLAAASDLDLAQATDAVIVGMSTYGIGAQEATRISNNLVAAADASVAEVSQLADAMKVAGPTMAAFGWPLEDVNTGLAVLSQRGIVGAEAGTALRSMMTNLMRPTDAVTDALGALNVSLYDEQGHLKALPTIIGELGTSMEGLTEQQRLQNVQTLFGTYGMKAAHTLLAEGTAGWAEMERKIGEAATAQEVAAERTKGFNASMEALGGMIQTFMIVAGKPLIETILMPIIEKVQDIVQWLLNLDPKWVRMGVIIAGVVAVAGPLITILGVMSTVLGAILSPIGLIVVAVVALAVAWVKAQGGIGPAIEKLKEFGTEIWEKLQPALAELRTWLEVNVPIAMAAVAEYWKTTLKPALEALWQWIQESLIPALERFGLWLGENIPVAMAAIKRFWENTLRPALEKLWQWIQESLIPALERFGLWLGENIPVAMQAVSDFWENTLRPAFEAVYTWITESLIPGIENLVKWFKEDLPSSIQTVRDWFDKLMIPLKAIWQWIDQNLLPVFTALADFFGAVLGLAIKILVGLWTQQLQPALTDAWTIIKDNVIPIVEKLEEWFGKLSKKVGEEATPKLAELKEKILDKLPGVLKSINGLLSSIAGGFKTLADKVRNVKLPAWLTPGSSAPLELALDGIGHALKSLTGYFSDFGYTASKAMKNVGKGLMRFVEAISGIVSLQKAMGGGVSFAGMGGFIEQFKQVAVQIVAAMQYIQNVFSYDVIKKLQNTAKRVKVMMDAVIRDFSDIKAIDLPDMDAWRKSIVTIVSHVVLALQEMKEKFRDWGLENASKTAEYAQGIVGFIKPMVDAIADMAAYEPAQSLEERVRNFVERVLQIIPALTQLASDLGELGLEAAADFAEAAVSLISLIKPAIDAIVELSEYEPVRSVKASIEDVVGSLLEILPELVTLAGKFETEGLEAAGLFAEATNKVLVLIKPAIDAVKDLATYEGVVSLRPAIRALVDRLLEIIPELVGLAGRFDMEALDAARAFSEAAEKILGLIKPAVDAITALAESKTISDIRPAMDAFREHLWVVLTGLMSMADDYDVVGLAQAEAFAKTVADVAGYVKSTIDVLLEVLAYKMTDITPGVETFEAHIMAIAHSIAKMARLVSDTILPEALRFQYLAFQVRDAIWRGLDALGMAGQGIRSGFNVAVPATVGASAGNVTTNNYNTNYSVTMQGGDDSAAAMRNYLQMVQMGTAPA